MSINYPRSKTRRIPHHHLVVFTQVEQKGYEPCSIHAVYALHTDCPVLVDSFARYVLQFRRRFSLSWQQNSARALGLYIDFMQAHEGTWSDAEGTQSLSAFAEALVAGTINDDGYDASGLYWPPGSVERANYLLSLVTAYSDWLVQKLGRAPLNPWRRATLTERIAAARRAAIRNERSAFPRHRRRRDVMARTVAVQRRVPVGERVIKAFPAERFGELLDCFVRPGKPRAEGLDRINVRNVMIALLLKGGGMRLCEPFHLYVSDVEPDPSNPRSALVRLYHPEQGEAPQDSGLLRAPVNREDYLKRRWGRVPRTWEQGRFHAGWKHLFLTDSSRRCAEVHWFPPVLGEAFLCLFNYYCRHIRGPNCPHPFLFVSENDKQRREPYTIDAYAGEYAKAIKRLALVPRKNLGTTPHGLRHDFASGLAEAGADRPVIQRALHHRSPHSQDVYTGRSAKESDRSWSAQDIASAQAFFSRLLPDPFEPGESA